MHLPQNLGADEVLVELRAASLNYRDLMIAKGGRDLRAADVVPGSDGAGIVVKTGCDVKSVTVGDRVVTHMVQGQEKNGEAVVGLDDDTLPVFTHISHGLGHGLNGTLATHGVFRESCIIKIGDFLTFEEAATLTCSGITAWNALMGLKGQELKKGDWILVEGTGGVSIAALQFALAIGATVIATTSDEAKAVKLRELGAHHVINYREVTEWGRAAKELTPNGRGVDMVVDIGGDATVGQSIEALKTNGLVVLTGLLGSVDKPDSLLLRLIFASCVARGILLGTRQMMRDMVQFVEANGVKPALDDQVFSLESAKDAYDRMKKQKHFSKVVIQIPGNH
ncbi:hypothetical protein B0I35DRAFT_449745 [Stachybotrys elegans]|uniref:Enoyl reductase (ER) domain-containing protein n=1 Tax=Stachybotrys elegans TaxID=80388 RepID=A0A8K0SUB3_9HYPO|nr:hypothetical protein B0I35DRAFT_449745 [Stachybotrys elegans]